MESVKTGISDMRADSKTRYCRASRKRRTDACIQLAAQDNLSTMLAKVCSAAVNGIEAYPDKKRKVKTGRESGLVTKPIHKLKPMIPLPAAWER